MLALELVVCDEAIAHVSWRSRCRLACDEDAACALSAGILRFFFFSSSPTHSFSAPSKSLAKGTLRGTIGLDVSYFLFLREGELIVIITIVIIRRIKGGESGGKGTRFHCDCSHAHDKTRCYAIHPRHAFTRSRSFRHPSPATCPPGSARRCDDIPANQSQRSQC
mgnify:CR=1 FL=1